ncbi:MAG: hypothetical protein JJU31_03665 [Wenzhouxiangella sp.]|nr:hypothetical protein [Wenzhouxiangella sp.]MCH8476885.1 sulfotransferase [Wenzhouxiangella sp.]TVR91575.1 MAG: HAD family hydrolase [Wenzhouxiangellaceae bacterium]
MKIAMWSGPRNISTAMMRAWENRRDCAVVDEPLYAAWLADSGADHPGRDEVIAAGETDWRKVVARLTGPNPDGQPLWYQKHMCHHLIDGMSWDWIANLTNVFLVRRPDAVVASYVRARGTEQITPDDIGLPRQIELFDWLSQRQAPPPVIDSDAFLGDPRGHLQALCRHLGIDYNDCMLHWPPGPRDSDGVWAPHWYASVQASTGFQPPRQQMISLSGALAAVADACQPQYQALMAHRLVPERGV